MSPKKLQTYSKYAVADSNGDGVITDEELEFWNKIGISPTYMFEDYGIDDEFSYDVKTQRTVTQ